MKKVRDKFEGEVRMVGTGDILRIDQEHLETVIPGRSITHTQTSITHTQTPHV